MAYFDQDDELLLWLSLPKSDDLAIGSQFHLMAEAREQEAEVSDSEPACAYIIRGWFGPFLFAPTRRFMRGRC